MRGYMREQATEPNVVSIYKRFYMQGAEMLKKLSAPIPWNISVSAGSGENCHGGENRLRNFLIALMIGLSSFSALVFAIPVGDDSLSIFRILLLLFSAYYFACSKIKLNIYSRLMITWFAYGLATVIWCYDISAWMQDSYFLFAATMLTLISEKFITGQAAFLKVCRFFIAFIILHNVIGYYEIITRDFQWVPAQYLEYYARDGLPVSTFANPNNYAFALLIGVAFAGVCLAVEKRAAIKLLYAAVMLSCAYLIVKTDSRGNLLALIFGISVWFLLRVKNTNKFIFFLVIIAASIMALLFTSAGDVVSDLIKKNLHFSMEYGSERARLYLLKDGLDVFMGTYGFGAGTGNLAYQISHFGSHGMSGGDLHFWYLEILFTFGPVIWAGYTFAYVKLGIRLARDARNRASSTGAMAGCLFAYMCAFAIASISISSGLGNEVQWVPWALCIAFVDNILPGTNLVPKMKTGAL